MGRVWRCETSYWWRCLRWEGSRGGSSRFLTVSSQKPIRWNETSLTRTLFFLFHRPSNETLFNQTRSYSQRTLGSSSSSHRHSNPYPTLPSRARGESSVPFFDASLLRLTISLSFPPPTRPPTTSSDRSRIRSTASYVSSSPTNPSLYTSPRSGGTLELLLFLRQRDGTRSDEGCSGG